MKRQLRTITLAIVLASCLAAGCRQSEPAPEPQAVVQVDLSTPRSAVNSYLEARHAMFVQALDREEMPATEAFMACQDSTARARYAEGRAELLEKTQQDTQGKITRVADIEQGKAQVYVEGLWSDGVLEASSRRFTVIKEDGQWVVSQIEHACMNEDHEDGNCWNCDGDGWD